MKKVLVIVDMQNDFIEGALGNDDCRACVKEVVKAVEQGTYTDIILTRDTHFENYLDTQEGKRLPVKHCIKDTEGWQINSEVMAAVNKFYEKIGHKNVVIIDKLTFGSLELADILKNMVEEGDVIDFCGVCTAICVISNISIAKAAVPEVTVRLIENATACVTKESKQAAIATAKMIQTDII